MRTLLTLWLLAGGAAALAQPGNLDNRAATPIDRASLERLNLRADWNAYIPIAGKRDGLANIQPVDETQVFVQTKAGMLVALDARTGRQQWSYKFPGSFAGTYPVAVNDKYCFAVGVGKLFCFDRFTGALKLEQDLRDAFPHREETPVSGPVADNVYVYLQMASGWLVSYELPVGLQSQAKSGKGGAAAAATVNVADQTAKQYATRFNPPQDATEATDYRVKSVATEQVAGANRDQASPSISALYSVVPPYQLNRGTPVASLNSIPHVVNPPYSLVPDHMKYKQQSPSISSQAALHRLEEDSSLRAVGEKFKRSWRYVMPQRSTAVPVSVDNALDPRSSRLWMSTDGATVFAVNKASGMEEVVGKFDGVPLHPLVGPYAFTPDRLLGFVSLDSGIVLAIDLTAGVRSPDRSALPVVYQWKVPVGGQLSNAPVVGGDAVYLSGARNGCVKVDVKLGAMKWRTSPEFDRVLAVNRDYVYVQDNRGRLAVFPKDGQPDPRTKYLRPYATLDLPAFTVAASNDKTDRVLMGGENGLITCLRDATAQYAKPTRIAPPATMPPPKAEEPKPGAMPPGGMPPMGEPKN